MADLSAGEILSRLRAYQKPSTGLDQSFKKAAVAMLLRHSEGAGLEMLFIQRAAHERDPWSGHMAFPGGRVDPGDATPLAAAVRETQEEIGVVLDPASLVASVREIQASARGAFLSMIVYPFVFMMPADAEITTNHEVARVVWVPVSLILDPNQHTKFIHNFETRSAELKCIDYEGSRIWGMTYRMLENFREAVQGL
ncbi:MAG TPA: CoA pyrophosphatase [Leptospiraceae bacterium]|nr:CoA pyrophosphatase [Leptospiraceae bacterium]